jgi:hypothetical protein
VIDALDKTLIPGAHNEELKALLVKVRPAFVAHLEHHTTCMKNTRGTVKDRRRHPYDSPSRTLLLVVLTNYFRNEGAQSEATSTTGCGPSTN